jgi:hypothetical protein
MLPLPLLHYLPLPSASSHLLAHSSLTRTTAGRRW